MAAARNFLVVALHICVGFAGLHASGCSTSECGRSSYREDLSDEMALIQLSRPKVDERQLNLSQQPEVELDEHPLKHYNFGVRWNEWYDDMVSRFPPSKAGRPRSEGGRPPRLPGDRTPSYSTVNYGLASHPLHKCAANVPAGEPGHNWPFNHTAGANMYATLASKSPRTLAKAQVLEVSSGRGGGSAVLSDCFCPSEMIGLDFSPKQVNSSQARYGRKGKCPIRFVHGDAMHLPFDNSSFDVIVNVEASHTYPSFHTFMREVWRVLRPGGSFLSVDFRKMEDADTDALIMENVFKASVFPIDLTEMVLRSFDENKLIKPFIAACNASYTNKPLVTAQPHSANTSVHCAHFAGTGFTAPHLRNHQWNYRMYILEK